MTIYVGRKNVINGDISARLSNPAGGCIIMNLVPFVQPNSSIADWGQMNLVNGNKLEFIINNETIASNNNVNNNKKYFLSCYDEQKIFAIIEENDI